MEPVTRIIPNIAIRTLPKSLYNEINVEILAHNNKIISKNNLILNTPPSFLVLIALTLYRHPTNIVDKAKAKFISVFYICLFIKLIFEILQIIGNIILTIDTTIIAFIDFLFISFLLTL